MELLNPTITVRNTDAQQLLVRFEHKVSEAEHIDLQLLVTKQDLSLVSVQRELLTKAIAHLQLLHDRLTPRM